MQNDWEETSPLLRTLAHIRRCSELGIPSSMPEWAYPVPEGRDRDAWVAATWEVEEEIRAQGFQHCHVEVIA